MRVILFNTLYHPYKVGGAELSVQALAEKFSNLGLTIGVVTLAEEEGEFEINGVKIWRLKLENTFWPFGEQVRSNFEKLQWHLVDVYNTSYKKKINEIINLFYPDVIHTNNLSGFSVHLWKIIKTRNIKIVHTLRDYYLLCPKTTKFKNGNTCTKTCVDCAILSFVKKKASQNVDAVVGISDYILNEHIENGLFKNAQKKVIFNGFEINETNNKPLIFDHNSYLKFGYIGQINKAKGVEVLLKSLSNYKSLKNWEICVAGKITDKYKQELELLLPKEKLRLIGYTNQEIFFEKINILIVPSIWEEPFGRVVLEGLINNKVVLVSNRGALKELLSNNSSFTFNPNENDLKQFLGNILNNPSKLGLFKHDTSYVNCFSLNKTAQSYKELFLTLMK